MAIRHATRLVHAEQLGTSPIWGGNCHITFGFVCCLRKASACASSMLPKPRSRHSSTPIATHTGKDSEGTERDETKEHGYETQKAKPAMARQPMPPGSSRST